MFLRIEYLFTSAFSPIVIYGIVDINFSSNARNIELLHP